MKRQNTLEKYRDKAIARLTQPQGTDLLAEEVRKRQAQLRPKKFSDREVKVY